MARFLVSLTLVLMVVMAMGPLVIAIPSPSGDFLSWCAYKYGAPLDGDDLITNLVGIPFGPDMGVAMMRPFKQAFLDNQWLPWDAASTSWSQNMHGMVQPLGVFQLEGHQHPPTLGEFQQSPSTYVKAALTKVAQLLQQPLLDIATQAGIPIDCMIFQAMFKWLKTNGNESYDTCMPYCKAKVSRKRKRHDKQVKHFNIHKGGYLRMFGGLRPNNKKVVECAHRLVCFAFNGPPPHSSHKVVSHLCNNPTCLNPRHMQWDSLVGNFAHPQ
jgi:hypothetical protein